MQAIYPATTCPDCGGDIPARNYRYCGGRCDDCQDAARDAAIAKLNAQGRGFNPRPMTKATLQWLVGSRRLRR